MFPHVIEVRGLEATGSNICYVKNVQHTGSLLRVNGVSRSPLTDIVC